MSTQPLSLMGRMRSLFANKEPGADRVALAEREHAKSVELHQEAQTHLAALRKSSDTAIIAGLEAGDESALEKTKRAIADAEKRVEQLADECRLLAGVVHNAKMHAAASQEALAWQQQNTIELKRLAAAKRLQDACDAYADAFTELVQLSELAWSAVPPTQRPPFRPATYGKDLIARVQMYVSGRSKGLLFPDIGNWHANSQKPNLVDQVQESSRVLRRAVDIGERMARTAA